MLSRYSVRIFFYISLCLVLFLGFGLLPTQVSAITPNGTCKCTSGGNQIETFNSCFDYQEPFCDSSGPDYCHCRIVVPISLTAQSSEVPSGGSTTLNWSSNYPKQWNPVCTAGNDWGGTKGSNGNELVGPLYTPDKVYSLACKFPGGPTGTDDSSVLVKISGAFVDIKANGSDGPITVNQGSTVELGWDAPGSVVCGASGDWSGDKSTPSGYEYQGPLNTIKTYTYKITCSPSAKTGPFTDDTVQVKVVAPTVTKTPTPTATATSTPGAQVNGAICTSITAPASVNASQTFTASVVMQNSGTKPWTSGGTNPYGLWDESLEANWPNGRWRSAPPGPGGVPLAVSPINPGQSATFKDFSSTAPKDPTAIPGCTASGGGSYSCPFEWRMVEQGKEWFGDVCKKTITVTVPLIIPTLTATPPSGVDPLSVILTASDTGTGAGTINYSFWYKCTSTATTVSATQAACGNLPTPPAGSCSGNGVGYKCDGITTNPKSIPAYDYTPVGTHTAKVVIERGSAPSAEKRTTITVTTPPPNSAPTASNVTATQPNYCSSGPGATISWKYTDVDGDPQSAFQVQVDDNSNFSSPTVDSGKVSSSGKSYLSLIHI